MVETKLNENNIATIDKIVVQVQIVDNQYMDLLKKSNYAMDVYLLNDSSNKIFVVIPLSKKIDPNECLYVAKKFFIELGINIEKIAILNGKQIDLESSQFVYIRKKGKLYTADFGNKAKDNRKSNNILLPQFTNLYQMNQCNLLEKEEVIQGMARTSNVGLLTAVSKAGKSQAMIELAIAVASGGKWFDKLQCSNGNVLFVNLELDDFNFRNRFNEALDLLNIQNREDVEKNIDILNCRSYNIQSHDLFDLIKEKTKIRQYKLIIIDPIYVIGNFDENSAEQVGEFMRSLIILADQTNSLVFITHHASKGDKSKVSAIDRGSGSGSFARSVDVLMDMSLIDASKVFDVQSDSFFRIESTLRNYPIFEPFEIEYAYPLHVAVNGLEDAPLQYGKKVNKQKEYDLEISKSVSIVGQDINQVSKYLNLTLQTLRNHVKNSNKYRIQNNQICLKEDL